MKTYKNVSKRELEIARSFITERDKDECQICSINFINNPNAVKNIDHIIPRSAVSFSHPFNLQLLCSNCNEEKGGELLDDYYLVLLNNVKKTCNWFLFILKPVDDYNELGSLYDLYKKPGLKNKSSINIPNHFDVFSTYYHDDYINLMIGIKNEALDLYNNLHSIFYDKIEDSFTIELSKLQLFLKEHGYKSPAFRAKLKEFSNWAESVAYKLYILDERKLSNRYRQTAERLRSPGFF